MSDKEKIIVYEMHIEDMLHALVERLSEFDNLEANDLFQQGRQLAYIEMMEIIKTRHRIIMDVIKDEYTR